MTAGLPYLDIVGDESRRLADAARRDLAAPIAGCPDWDVAALVGHVGMVQRFAAATIEARSDGPVRGPDDPPLAGDAVLEWFEDGARRLVAVLADLDPGEAIWTWSDEQVGRFWHRRMAHELVVHRWDVAAAVGADTAIDSEVAADGVDEVCHVGLRFSMSRPERSYPNGSLHLHRTDGDGEWMLRPEGGTLSVTREHAKGDIAVRGPAPDLLLYLWGRPHGELETFGDADLVEAWRHVAP